MIYALFCDNCKLGSFSDEKIDPFICDKCINNQPKRSKREDVEDLGHDFVTVGCTDHRYCIKCHEEDHVVKSTMMRCSEHYGNIVRPAEKIWPA